MRRSMAVLGVAALLTFSLPQAADAGQFPPLEAYLKASNVGAQDEFGSSVAVSGDTLVIGAPREDSSATGVNGDESKNDAPQSGAVYVDVRSGSGWTQQAYLKAANAQAEDQFGVSVAVAGDTIVVGAPLEDGGLAGVNPDPNDESASNAGAAYVFVRNGTTWTQQAYLKASNPDFSGQFGISVAVSEDGNTVLIGANGESNSGAAYVFVRNGTTWSQQAYLKASNPDQGDNFGSSVSVSGDTVVVGAVDEDSSAIGVNALQNDNSMSTAGAAYVFVRNGTTWSQQAYLKASNTTQFDRFGAHVAVSGDTVAVSAPGEGSDATGVNGDEDNENAQESGATYVFVRNGTTWSQQAYLKAHVEDGGAHFGATLALSGDRIVVGMPDIFLPGLDEGIAYVFERSRTTWFQEIAITLQHGNKFNDFGSAVAASGDSIVVGARGEANGGPQAGAAYAFRVCGSIMPYGLGCAGTGGIVPQLRAGGCASPGGIVAVEVSKGSGGARMLLFGGSAPASIPFVGGCSFLIQPPVAVFGPVQLAGFGPGNGSLFFDVAVPPGTAGMSGVLQAFVIDPANPVGAAGTNALEITLD